ncbi:methyl-accepting chemotaxis protein [Pseudomonas sp. WHRI 8822A]|uniref:methyl-accepting chemotaxis protein n=1 Tax=Pseudomonas sp. WHRI 8822A TaxID=3162568 RepID=UPI0032EAE268
MLGKLSIAKKMGAGFGLIILIMMILVAVARNGFDKIEQSVAWNIHTYQVIDNLSGMLVSLTNIETGMRGFALSGSDEFLDPLTNGKQAFGQHWQALKQLTADNPVQQKRLDELRAIQERWLSGDIEATLSLRREVVAGSQPMAAVIQRINERQDKTKMDGMRQLISDMRNDEEKLLGIRKGEMASASSFATLSLIAGGLLATIAAIVVALSLSSSIKRRLLSAMGFARAIAEGDLNSKIPNENGDEISGLMSSLHAMQVRLRSMIAEIMHGSQQLLSAARDISSTSEQLAGAAQEQSHAASTMAATVEELTVSISHVAANANEAHEVSNQSGQQSADGGEVIQRTLQSMSQIAGTVQSSSQQIAALGLNIEQISSIVSVITSIAEQTNLLALNAAIEAARAGEQGRGFAVVADEVRLLAQRTGKSTQEITEMIKQIQLSAQSAVTNMEVGVQQVNAGVELAHSATIAIVQIKAGSTRIVDIVNQISIALQQQAVASQDVARSVERIAQMAESSNHGITGAAESAARVEQLALSLNSQVSQFRL